MSKMLPFKHPIITSWPWTAATFSILENYSNSLDWLYNNYVQIFCEHYDSFISIHYLPHTDVFSLCPFFHSSLIPRNFLTKFKIDIIDFIKFCIDSNYYVYCFVDESFINDFMTDKFLHELLIYGYTDTDVAIADFALSYTQKYTFGLTSFSNFREAYYSVNYNEDEMQDGIGGNGGILIFSVNQNETYNLNKNLLITSLEDYFSCIDSSNMYRTYNLQKAAKFNPDLRNVCFGIDIYEEIYDYYTTLEKNNKYFLIQPLHVLYDYKVLMLQRLYYLKEKKYFCIPNNLISEYTNLVDKTKVLRNLGIKYWICKKTKILDAIGSSVLSLKERDISITLKLLSILKV